MASALALCRGVRRCATVLRVTPNPNERPAMIYIQSDINTAGAWWVITSHGDDIGYTDEGRQVAESIARRLADEYGAAFGGEIA